ncbi:hypothetical protein KPH14_010456 [Odynerus spinipes]|uniref:Amine oxidase domain-containing protein n=1 Tax=Odynerus spinipes TaxID=1348599 RepID=A0AAD9RTX4_9HYME|nr:hypothetical protein KPH14_010456 [Odynerus spinipes]
MAARRPGLTKTQALRQAKAAAFVKQYQEKKETTSQPQVDLPKRRKKSPVCEPKKVDFSKPGLTKAMLARMKHSEKFKEDYDRKKQAEAAQIGRRPRRTPAPIGGDARAGREKMPRKEPPQRAGRAPPPAKGPAAIPQKTRALAKTINADVVQAEPLGDGPIDSIVIPAGTIKDNRTTVISISQAGGGADQMANRSMQVISETLDEQDAAEAEAVQSKLDELQQARRDFVMAVANVGGNAVNIEDAVAQRPETPPRHLYRVPELDDPVLQIEYTMDHPIIEAAREFMRKSLAAMEEREAAKRLDQEFQRLAQQETGLRLDVPFEEELYQDHEISWEEDEEIGMTPIPSRVKATMEPIPERAAPYRYSPFDPEELERFFDVENYPPVPPTPPTGPPPGREHLHRDLWELDDPWYMPPPEPDVPDLIQFDCSSSHSWREEGVYEFIGHVKEKKNEKMFNEPKILIIGAGAAGIAAAKRLLEKGFQNVTILEASDRIGGRIHTVEFSNNVVDLGAQWVHGERGNVVFNLAFPHKLLDSSKKLHDFSKHIFITPKGTIIPQEHSTEALKIYYDISDRATEELKNATGSYGDYFSHEFCKILKEKSFANKEETELFLDWIQKFDNSVQCSDTWFDVSAKGITEYWQCEGDALLNWKTRGYKTVFDLLMNKIPDSKKKLNLIEKIEFNKEVILIDYTSTDNVIVKVKDGSKYTASHVIFTASLGVLKEKHAIMFLPLLPETKQCAIKGLSIGTANKVFLEFPHAWWKKDCAGFSLCWTKEDKIQFLERHGQDNAWLCDVFEFFTVDYQPTVLCAWIVGQNARYIETLSDVDIIERLYFLLEIFLGKTYNIPRPDHMIRSKWYTNSNFRGSYSFRSMMSEELNVQAKDLAEPIVTSDGKPLVLFAGEATHDHYYSTVHGAVESGFREADRLLKYQRRLYSHL